MMVGAKSFHKVLNNEERSLVGYWASSALQGPQLSPCCNRVVRKGTQISETLSPCPSDLCKSNRVWRKLLWPHWSPGDTHLMFWNQQSGYKLPQRHRDLGRLWPQSHRVTSGLSRQVCAPCPAPPPTRGCHPASRLSLPRPECLKVLPHVAVLPLTAWHHAVGRVYLGHPEGPIYPEALPGNA